MAKRWTHTAAFAHFGTKPKNVQWSWSARNEDTKTVVVTLWQDRLRKDEQRLTYARTADNYSRGSPGLNEFLGNLAWAQDHCDGRLNVIIAKARDLNAEPRSIDECFPTKIVMRLTHLDRETGTWAAEAESPVSSPPRNIPR